MDQVYYFLFHNLSNSTIFFLFLAFGTQRRVNASRRFPVAASSPLFGWILEIDLSFCKRANVFDSMLYRIISDKYIVSCGYEEGTLKIWDLQSLLTMEICDRCPHHKSSSDLLLKVLPSPQNCYMIHGATTLVSADEFQIVVADIDQRNRKKVSSFLLIKSFVGKMGAK